MLTLFFVQQSFSSEKEMHFTSITAVSYKIISVEIKYPSKLHILPSSQFDIICHGRSNNILILNISANSQMTYLRFHTVQSILQVSCIFTESQNKHNHKSNKMYIKKTFIITTYSGSTRMYMGEINFQHFRVFKKHAKNWSWKTQCYLLISSMTIISNESKSASQS